MLARFFIDRPIFAWVISIVIVLMGLLASALLPIAQYPEITPPTVSVTCQYSGASAVVVADTVAAPIEQQVNGVENMLYMSSQCTNNGAYSLTVTFKLGVDLNMAQVLVQNRVSQAMPTLPDVVKATGVIVKKKSPSILLVVNLFSELNPSTSNYYFSQLDLSNYATIYIKDVLARLSGVGDISMLGQQDYSMRVWLDPDKLASRGLKAGDVANVLREQNVQVAAGQIGQQPVPRGQDFQYTMTTVGRLNQAEEFGNIILKTDSTSVTYLHDVARTELGARNQDTLCRLDGSPSVGLAIFQLPGSNALDTGDRVKAEMRRLAKDFQPGLKYAIVYDTTPFIKESVNEVFHTLRDAVILVALVVLFFLQDWKSLILPLIDVAVSLIGTFIVMSMLGFSLNNLTLFGLVLAIGIVVDDSIVVLENIERWLDTGASVRDATIHAMDEITGPIIAITLVLSSVFIPSAFLGGITGQFYRQFALTISASMIFSAVNAMTMTPARAGSIFKPRHPGSQGHDESKEALPWWIFGIVGGVLSVWLLSAWFGEQLGLPTSGEHAEAAAPPNLMTNLRNAGISAVLFLPGAIAGGFIGLAIIKPVNFALGLFFRGFNRIFDLLTNVYGATVGWLLRLSFIVMILYAGLLYLTYFGFTQLPVGFIPSQDKGYLVVNIELPNSASLERTLEVTKKVEKIAKETHGVANTVSIIGSSVVLNSAVSSNFGSMFIVLKPFHERHGADEYSDAIAAKVRNQCYKEIEEARIAVFGAPAVDGLGNSGGFKLMVEQKGELKLRQLEGKADNLAEKANQIAGLVGVFNSFRAGTPQYFIDVDRVKCKTLNIKLSDVFDTLQIYMGGYYVNDFNKFSRTWQVNIQAEPTFRLSPEMVGRLKVANAQGEMIPLGTLVKLIDSTGPVIITRYNMFPAAPLLGGSLPGVSTGYVVESLEALADTELPKLSMGYEWTELTFMQKEAGKTESLADLMQNPLTAFAGAVVLVFLVLAAQYESWSLPLAVILVVPMCLLCALTGIAIARMDINIFVQVGFIVLVGLACKNAILVVEFAHDRQERDGMSAFDAAIASSKTRCARS